MDEPSEWDKQLFKIVNRFVRSYLTYKSLDERMDIVTDLVEALRETPEDILTMALEELTNDSPQFLPTIGQIRAKIKAVAERTTHENVWSDLIREQCKVMQTYDPAAWIALAARMKKAGMVFTAARLQERAEHYADISAAFQQVQA